MSRRQKKLWKRQLIPTCIIPCFEMRIWCGPRKFQNNNSIIIMVKLLAKVVQMNLSNWTKPFKWPKVQESRNIGQSAA
jgi:hypothetical protein